MRALTRLADGSARPRDRAAFESYAAISPAAHQELERQRRVAALVRAGGPQMPADLRRRLLAKPPDPTAAGSRRRAGRSPATVWAPAVVAFAVLVAVVATGAWRLTAGGARESPTIARVAMLALRDPTSALPHPAAGQPSSVGKPFAGVTFPDYQRAFGVDAWGQRTDVTGNRTIRTVYYRLGDGVPISYSVVSGASLPVPPSAHHVLVAGVRITSYTQHRLSVVTLIRHGRTCVLAGAAPARTILALAAAPLLTPARV